MAFFKVCFHFQNVLFIFGLLRKMHAFLNQKALELLENR